MTFNLPIAQLETLARTSCAHALWAVFSVADFERYSGWLVLGLIVLLTYQQWRLHQFRRQTAEREKLFRIVAENAADMIALVDAKGKRLYNSPAYEKVLGYSQEELAKTAIFEQIHPEDRLKVLEAGRDARSTGVGKKLQYRMRHKDGTWKVLESSATTIMNAQGDVEQLVIVNRDITDRTLAEEKVEQSSFRDSLTQLPNRHLFIDRLQHAFARAERNLQYQYAILLVDVDHFKEFNQNIGTSQGDKVILELARRLASSIRHDDTVARPQGEQPIPDAVLSRMGGDEFTILLEGIKDASDALRVAERIQKAIGQPFTVEGRELIVSASIGIALSSTGHARAEDLLHDADIAMRRAKTLGGSRSEIFDEAMHARAVGRLKLEAELRNAIESDQFCLFYQPVVHLDSETITGFEALLRWHHPKQGLISPQKFFDVAENVGLIVVIGRWALRQGCAQIRALSSRGSARDRLNITVNISAKQLAYPNLVSDVRGAVQDTRIEPSQLLLEITETDAMADPKKTLEVFSQLKAIGVGISIADFGTGHSSLSWLRRLPIDELKIDRSLIASMSTDRCSADIVQLILNVGCELNLRVVAQGIESAIHLAWLKKLHCEFGQGFYFSEPLDAAKAEKLLNGFHFPIAASTTAR